MTTAKLIDNLLTLNEDSPHHLFNLFPDIIGEDTDSAAYGITTKGIVSPELIQEVEDKYYWYGSNCGHVYDCCGCKCSQSLKFTKISRGKYRVIFSERYNY